MIRRAGQDSAERVEHIKRLALFNGTSLSPGDALALDDGEINASIMLRNGVQWDNVVAARIDVRALKEKHGFEQVSQLKQLGLDALELSDAALTQTLIELYGVEQVRLTFCCTPDDATSLVASEGARLLDLSNQFLLEMCAGAPIHAESVLKALGAPKEYLATISIRALLDSGLRGGRLINMGLNAVTLISEMKPTPTSVQIRELGIENKL